MNDNAKKKQTRALIEGRTDAVRPSDVYQEGVAGQAPCAVAGWLSAALVSCGLGVVLLLVSSCAGSAGKPAGISQPPFSRENEDKARSIAAFQAVANVLLSPRCANCHPAGDSPLQGDDRHPHTMNVKRGPDGRGTPAMRCTNCHQEETSSAAHTPPGAHDWRLPPPNQRMAWSGLSAGDLARLLKDPAQNGNRSLEDLIKHVTHDHFIAGAWHPGPGRTPPPMSHEEFVSKFTEWVRTGAYCP